jgi:hypothetical protein
MESHEMAFDESSELLPESRRPEVHRVISAGARRYAVLE